MDHPQRAQFESQLQQSFEIHYGEGTLPAKLVEINAPPLPDRSEDEVTPFSAIFHTEESGFLEQRIYEVENETLGKLHLFLVPVGPGKEGGMQYEAIFS